MPSRFIIGNITWYSVLIVSGVLIAIVLATMEERRKNLPKDTILDISIAIIPAGLIGARLYYVLFNLDYFLKNPQNIIKIWNGGMAIYGSIIFGTAVCYIICKQKKVSFLSVMDCIAPGLVLAQSIGRWGNFFNQEAYGRAVLDNALQFFPYSVYIQGKGYFMATFFYESICNLIIFIYLWKNRKNVIKDGDLFFRYLAFYGCVRTFIEGLRSDSLYWGDVRVSQLLSMLLVICVLVYFLYRFFKSHKSLRKSFYFSIAVICISIIFAFLQKYDYFLLILLIGIIIGVESIYISLMEEKL